MLTSLKGDGTVFARDVTKQDGPFYCASCCGETVVKKGRVKIDHFAHKPPTTCTFSKGETEEHREAKLEIYAALSQMPCVTNVRLEQPMSIVRPDVSYEQRGKRIAIEVQVSTLSDREVERRTLAYKALGMYVLWLPPLCMHDIEFGKRYVPSAWEKYLHALYFGNVYYWKSGQQVIAVHYDTYMLYKEESDFYEGYEYRSRRYRTPVYIRTTSLTDMIATSRGAWSSKTMSNPACNILTIRER